MMHVSLTEKLEDYVKSKVQSGLYNNASEVVREALRLKISVDETEELKLQRLRDAIEPAWQQAERGQCVPFDLQSILSELDQEMASNA
jgi:antitoxin ParD1/3/4